MAPMRVEDLVATPPGVRTGTKLDGQWRNALGSTLQLEVVDDHRLTGIFRPAPRHDADEQGHELLGVVEGTSFAFCVDFGVHGSVASWTGHLIADDRGERLEALWHLARERGADDAGAPAWGALLTGYNEFVRAD